jgi:predicted dehydrogenase
MSEKILRIGIAGYGVVGTRRRQIIDEHPRMRTVAVCDRRFAQAGAMPDGVQCFPHYQAMLEVPLDALFVSLPNYLAPEVTIAGLQRGLHVFCEKPPGRTVADIEAVIAEEARHPGLRLKYGFNHRYHDSVREALRIVQSGELGAVVNLRGVYGKSRFVPSPDGWRIHRDQAGGGILLDQGIHMVDLIRLFGGEFEEVNSFVSNAYWKCDVEDNAYAILRSRNGRVAMLHSSATQWHHRFSLEITLNEGTLELRGILSGSKSYGQEQLAVVRRDDRSPDGASREECVTYLNDPSWRDEIHEFADAVLGDTPIRHGTSADALATMKLVYRIYWADPAWRTAFAIANPESATQPGV